MNPKRNELALALLADAVLVKAAQRGEEIVVDRRHRQEEERRRNADEKRRAEEARQETLKAERKKRRQIFGAAAGLGAAGIPAKLGVDWLAAGSTGFPADFMRAAVNFPDGSVLVALLAIGVALIVAAGAMSSAFRTFPTNVKLFTYTGVGVVAVSGTPILVGVALGVALVALGIGIVCAVVYAILLVLEG